MTNSQEVIESNFSDEVNLGRYLNILHRWWRVILLCALLGTLAALAVSLILPKSYVAESSLAIIRSGTIVNFNSQIRTVSDTDPTTVNLDQVSRRKSLVTLGGSDDLAQAVANQLGNQLPEGLRDPVLLARLVKVSNDGDLILVQATTEDPVQAALIANTWAQLYQDRVNAVYSESPFNPEAVSAQADEAKKNYDTAQAALVTFLNTNPLEQLTRQRDLLATQLDNQVKVQAKLIQLESEAKALRQRIASGAVDASRGDELASLLLEASAFSNGAELPVNLQIALDQLNAPATSAERSTQLDSLIAAVQAREQTLQNNQQQTLIQQLNAIKSQIEQAQAKQKELTAARDLTWSTYQSLVTQAAATNITAEAKGQQVRLATPALAPTEASGTRRLVIILLGGVIGLLIGAGLAFVLEFFASGLSNAESVFETLHLPTLAILPDLPLAVEPNHPNKATSEELRRLRYTLFSHAGRRVVAITSAGLAKDASALAVQLAVVGAQAGKKVLLVDANLREPLLHTLFRLERTQGLSEALRTAGDKNATWQYPKASRIEGLAIMTAGAPVDDAAALLDTAAFRVLVATVQENFDIVILNAPPVLDVIDAVIVAQVAQGALLVLDSVNTSAPVASRAKQRLDDAQVPILGVVLTHTGISQTESAVAAQMVFPRFWSGIRTRMLQLLGPRPG